MNIIDKLISFLNKLYSNKYFKFIFLFAFFVVLFVNYNGNKIKSFRENLDNQKPLKINFNDIKKSIVEKQQQKKEIAKEQKERIVLNKENKIEKERIEDEIKSEFFSKSNVSNNRKVKNGDFVTIKILMIDNGKFVRGVKPINFSIVASNKSRDVFSKNIIGKHIGQVFDIKIIELLKEVDVALKENEKNYSTNKTDLTIQKSRDSFDSLRNTKIGYKVKIISISKP